MRRGLGFLSLAPLLCVAKGLRRLAIVNYSGSSQVLVSTCGVRVGSPALMRAMWHAHGPGPRCGLYVQIAGPAVPSVLAAEAAYSGLTGPGRDPFFCTTLCNAVEGRRVPGRGFPSACSLHRTPRLGLFLQKHVMGGCWSSAMPLY